LTRTSRESKPSVHWFCFSSMNVAKLSFCTRNSRSKHRFNSFSLLSLKGYGRCLKNIQEMGTANSCFPKHETGVFKIGAATHNGAPQNNVNTTVQSLLCIGIHCKIHQ
jgi:hypothetical protein